MTSTQDNTGEMIVEKDIMVETRDGSQISVNVYRPDGPGEHPVIVSMSPYGKDVYWPDRFPLFDVVDDGEHMVWETENPVWWVARGYAVVRADTRGTGHSPGMLQLFSRTEHEDCYDVIEWAADEPWSTGKVGMSGISWFGMLAWAVAALKPPHLAAIVPWDGLSDFYREWAYQGGVLHNRFTPFWWESFVGPNQYGIDSLSAEELAANRIDFADEIREHPFVDDWHRERTPDLTQIEIPVLSASSWGSLHLHLRGNVEGYLDIPSKNKRLLLFPGDHISPFYKDWAYAERLRFFDRWLKGISNGAELDPPVRMGLRAGDDIVWRDDTQWPPAQTEWRDFVLDAGTGRLGDDDAGSASVDYDSLEGSVVFTTPPVEGPVEVTGPGALSLWLSTTAADTDVFLAIWHLDGKGEVVPAYGVLGDQLPHATGVLRASRRTLDAARSTPTRPYHSHTEAVDVPRGEPIQLDIEIWPTSILMNAGDSLRLEISSQDRWYMPETQHDDPIDRDPQRFGGVNTVLTGGAHPSVLRLPFVAHEWDGTSSTSART